MQGQGAGGSVMPPHPTPGWPGVRHPPLGLAWGRQGWGWCVPGLAPHRVPSVFPQATAETVYDILSPAAPIPRSLQDKRSVRRLRKGHQPADLREGVAKAYDTVREVMRPCPPPSPTPASSPPTPQWLTSDFHRASWTRLRPSVMWPPGGTSRRG